MLRLSGVTTVIWLEGINDFSKNANAAVEDVVAAMREGVARLRLSNAFGTRPVTFDGIFVGLQLGGARRRSRHEPAGPLRR